MSRGFGPSGSEGLGAFDEVAAFEAGTAGRAGVQYELRYGTGVGESWAAKDSADG
ncbi:hypothetical protein ABT010_37755 [Streptomyces sp. NPDC002668]|uniref:hypothetical protein n=1 Tax=Streptomyces sp. NPDC002668 TaxID=3154422 RepID=UPI0033337ED9